eukprot:TRINITY_DN8909_c0_g1_i2.p1 TRINITY_DN8909_c0_g1~~TRINITY_DN8909_c0_g1_i2.p1  ORF type:complete len:598 (+),score=172.48 TRINITY_DN8909_c0_g1_i2:116-1909(+)
MSALFVFVSLFSLCVVKAGVSITPISLDLDDTWSQEGFSKLKFSEDFSDFVRHKNAEDSAVAWVIFTDKDVSAPIVLSPATCRRRVSEGGTCRPLERDYPVTDAYVQAVAKLVGGRSNVRTVSNTLNGVSVTATVKDYELLAVQPFVKEIDIVQVYSRPPVVAEPDSDVSYQKRSVPLSYLTMANGTISLDYKNSYESISSINAIPLHQEGYFGSGVSILVIDSGFYLSHEVFSNLTLAFNGSVNYIQGGQPVTPPIDDSDPADPVRSVYNGENATQYDHGTAILSLMGGFKNGTLIGVAFNATYLLAKTEKIPEPGVTSNQQQMEDHFVSAVEFGMSRSVDIISASLGYPTLYTRAKVNGQTGKSTIVVNSASDDGILVVVAVGNLGAAGVGPPADAPFVLSVGAANGDGKVADFSSIGPTVDGRIKPEVSALGVRNYVAVSLPTDLTSPYTRLDGTSLATPLVAGAAALIMQKNPSWTAKQVRYALMQTASLAAHPNNTLGWGLIDAFAASNFNLTAVGVCPMNCSSHGSCNASAPNPQCTCDSSHYDFACEMSFRTYFCVRPPVRMSRSSLDNAIEIVSRSQLHTRCADAGFLG